MPVPPGSVLSRLVQEVAQEEPADFSVLAELMMSGLVTARSGEDGTARETTYFTVRDEARSLLLRALRGADAEAVADALDQRISEHLSAIEGRSVRFSALVASPEGEARLPHWARPFAHLTTALRAGVRNSPAALSWQQIMAALNPTIVGRLARLATTDRPLGPQTVRADLWPYADNPHFIELSETGELKFRPEVAAHLKERLSASPYLGLRLCWVDDLPQNNAQIVSELTDGGAEPVMLATSTEQALSDPDIGKFDIILSDMARGDDHDAGYDLIMGLRLRDIRAPVIIFAGYSMASRPQQAEAMAHGAFGGTNRVDELLALLDSAARTILFNPDPPSAVTDNETIPRDGISDQPDPPLRELSDIPPGEFCTLAEISRQLLRAELIEDDRDVVDSLLIFRTQSQQTWLIATKEKIIFILDDENTRKDQKLVQRSVALTDVLPITAFLSDGSAVVRLGARTTRPWYYSESLFTSPTQIEDAIADLLEKALFSPLKTEGLSLSREQLEARLALRSLGIDCLDPAVLDIIIEAAKFRPPRGYDPQISMSRLLCGAMTVGEELPPGAAGNEKLRALSAVVKSAPWSVVRERLLAGFRREGAAEARARLNGGFSKNAGAALRKADDSSGSGSGLSSDALVQALLTPGPDYESSLLYRSVPDITSLRTSVEAYQRDGLAPAESATRPGMPPGLSRISKKYGEEIRRALNAHLAFPPDQRIGLGEIGAWQNGSFVPVGDFQSIVGETAPQTLETPTADLVHSSVSTRFLVTDERLSVDFQSDQGILLQLHGCRWISFGNIDQIASAVLASFDRGIWQANWHIVTEVLEVDAATIILAGGVGARAEFINKHGEKAPDFLVGEAEIASLKDIAYTAIAQAQMTPLFRLARVKRRLLGKPQFAIV